MTNGAERPDWDFRLDVVAAAFGKFRCNLRCPYCHRDYFLQSVPPATPARELADGVKLCHSVLDGSYSIHLAGSGEPLKVPQAELMRIVEPLRKLEGCKSISLTTNGYYLASRVDDLVALGIRDVNVSIPCLEPQRYHRVMRVPSDRADDIITRTLEGIRIARSRDIEVDVNTCVSYPISEVIDGFIKLSREHGVRVKLFPIIAVPQMNVAPEARYFTDMISLLSKRTVPKVQSTGRYLTIEWEFDGARLCAKPGDIYLRPYECYECSDFLRCQESCWRSVRVSPWYIQPCGIRTDNVYWYADENPAALRECLVEGGKIAKEVRTFDALRLITSDRLSGAPRSKFIVIEGPDGSGKTTLTKRLAQDLGLLRYQTPPMVFQKDDLKTALEQPGMEVARCLFYWSSMYYANLELRSILAFTGVVTDRWALSTDLYHKAMLDVEVAVPPEYRADLLEPDLTIVLDIDDAVQVERLRPRKKYFDKRWEESKDLREKINRSYRNHEGKGVVHIENNSTLEQALARCREEIKRHVGI